MERRWIQSDPLGVGSLLASGVIKAKLAEILRGWTDQRRPAVLFVVDGEDWSARVYAEDELLGDFPDAPVALVELTGRIVPGLLLIFVVEDQGATIYAIADPRAMN